MKENICTAAGVIGGFFAALLGGWDSALATLLIFMAIDFTTGLITASMGRSKHSKTGRLSSKAGWGGLAKKFCILLMVVVAVRMDIMIGTTYIRDATCICFCVNELLSIIENTSLMGIPYPPAIKKAIEVLQKRASHIDGEIQEMIDDMEDDKKIKYQYSDSVQITPHFNSCEFRCKCGKEHEFSVSDELVQKLEQLYAALNCSKIIVTSGFRCSAHDKAVKGSGTEQHTLGNAADICCYGQDGQPISSKTVCCKAQDIGFRGIANITAAYQYTHVDVRPNGKWYGDEVQGNSTVTDDFYKYFGEEDMKGIDVSVHNGNIDWGKVKADGIDFAILRAGFGRLEKQKDEKFEQNYADAKAVGLPIGAYWYSYAMTPEEAEPEADVFLSVIKGKQFEMPVYFDLEEKKQFDLGKEQVSAIMRAFLKKVESAGYFVGLYGSASSLTTHTADDIKSWYTIWLAHWCDHTNYSGAYGIWQHSEKGKVAGINGNVDLDICCKDSPTIIKGKGLNGYGKTEPTSTPAPDKPDTTVTATIRIGNDTYKGTLMKE